MQARAQRQELAAEMTCYRAGLMLIATAAIATPTLSLDPRRYPPSTSIELDRGVEPVIRTPLPENLFAPEDLPAAFSWRNVSSGARDASGNV